jgi:hypothetical protein
LESINEEGNQDLTEKIKNQINIVFGSKEKL